MIINPKFKTGDQIEFGAFDDITVTKQECINRNPKISVSCKLNGEDAFFPTCKFGRIMNDHRNYDNDYERLQSLAGTTRTYKKRPRLTHIFAYRHVNK